MRLVPDSKSSLNHAKDLAGNLDLNFSRKWITIKVCVFFKWE